MKKWSVLPLCIVTALLLMGFAAAAPAESDEGDLSKIEEALPGEAGDMLEGISADDAGAGEKGIDAIIGQIKGSGGIVKNAIKSAAAMLTIVLLSSVIASPLEDGGVKEAVLLISVVAVAAIAVDSVNSFIGLGIEVLNSLSDFSKVLLPTMCSAAISSGAVSSAAAKYAATALFMDVLMTVGIRVVMPMVMLYLTAVMAGAALGRESLSNIAKLLKWLCTTALTLLVTAFTLYLSVTGIITGKSDEMAVKITKSAIGTLLPVVGEVVSSAAETIVAGAGILRNSIGVFGMIGVAAVCVTPILTLGAHYLVFKGTAALSLALTDKRIADLIEGVGVAFGMVLALVGAAGAMLFISLISSMKAVTG